MIQLIALIVVIVLVVKFWFVVVPAIALGSVWYVVHSRSERRRLDAMTDEERAAVLTEKALRRYRATVQAQASHQKARTKAIANGDTKGMKISQVANRPSGGGLACPRCGGTSFKARRTGAARGGITAATLTTGGLGGLAGAAVTRQKRVQCATCGNQYGRG